MQKVRVKICCISSEKEAKLAIKYGTDALGLVGNMPSGPGVISDDLIHEISKAVPPPISTFLLTSETKAQKIIDHYKKVQTTTIQIVDKIEPSHYLKIKNELPHVKLVQVLHVRDEDSIQESKDISQYVDAILLDSGNLNLAVKELGGTGRTHDWEISRAIRESTSIPVFLAGGLKASNIKKAVSIVKPFGVDLCSGVRSDGQLDEKKLHQFFEALH
jgi:phosphoribosylanthranilate isomerase